MKGSSGCRLSPDFWSGYSWNNACHNGGVLDAEVIRSFGEDYLREPLVSGGSFVLQEGGGGELGADRGLVGSFGVDHGHNERAVHDGDDELSHCGG